MQTAFIARAEWKTLKTYDYQVKINKGDHLQLGNTSYEVISIIFDLDNDIMKVIVKPIRYHTDE